jgi:haloalkane dehalogenase
MTTQTATLSNPLFNKTNTVTWLPYEEFPFTSRFIDVDGNRIHYLDEGEGPLLLFVHGPMWMFVFRDVIKALRGRFRCVALDFPLTGLSEASSTYQPSIPNASILLEHFIQKLELRDITLVGHDVGGTASLSTATRLPEHFNGIVLNGAFGWSLNRHNKDVARFIGIVGSSLFTAINAQTNVLIRLTSGSSGVGKHLSNVGKRAFRGAYQNKQARRTLTQMFADILKQDDYLDRLEHNLKKLEHLPVLLAYGENDQGRKAGFQKRFESIFPKHSSVIIQHANHFPQMDAPHEVAETIKWWWEQRVGAK